MPYMLPTSRFGSWYVLLVLTLRNVGKWLSHDFWLLGLRGTKGRFRLQSFCAVFHPPKFGAVADLGSVLPTWIFFCCGGEVSPSPGKFVLAECEGWGGGVDQPVFLFYHSGSGSWIPAGDRSFLLIFEIKNMSLDLPLFRIMIIKSRFMTKLKLCGITPCICLVVLSAPGHAKVSLSESVGSVWQLLFSISTGYLRLDLRLIML